jgi:hypothetical protein
MQPLAQPLTELREEHALGVITSVRQAPMDRDMTNQWETDRFRALDGLDDVSGLRDRNVPSATRAIVPSMLLLVVRLRCVRV